MKLLHQPLYNHNTCMVLCVGGENLSMYSCSDVEPKTERERERESESPETEVLLTDV